MGGRGSMNLQVDAVVVAIYLPASFGVLPYINDPCLVNHSRIQWGAITGINLARSNGRYWRERFRPAGRDSGWWSGSMKSRYMRQPQNLEWLEDWLTVSVRFDFRYIHDAATDMNIQRTHFFTSFKLCGSLNWWNNGCFMTTNKVWERKITFNALVTLLF